MTKVIFIMNDGTTHEVDAAKAPSLMDAAKHYDISGIEGDCGGACACGTCHIYVTPEWLEAVGMSEGAEAEILEFAVSPQYNSRLACQIKITPSLDGITVQVPASQH